jgi:hypothetical protein
MLREVADRRFRVPGHLGDRPGQQHLFTATARTTSSSSKSAHSSLLGTCFDRGRGPARPRSPLASPEGMAFAGTARIPDLGTRTALPACRRLTAGSRWLLRHVAKLCLRAARHVAHRARPMVIDDVRALPPTPSSRRDRGSASVFSTGLQITRAPSGCSRQGAFRGSACRALGRRAPLHIAERSDEQETHSTLPPFFPS